ncbi:putative Tryptophanase [Triangularia verruculosa]|uniref:Tryptophanase n=1 Tax=Triangularia verruculosa TaxID=2587418 RepID=A0AAN6XRX7_9PEZI|nr:putative Tryptophanase [Triangularia verruculosa]
MVRHGVLSAHLMLLQLYLPVTMASVPVPRPPAHAALVVRSLPTASAEERERILEDVEYNVFAFPAGLLTCDFLSDSGTSAMTDVQWAALMRGDESYGRNWGYYCLLDAFRDIFERGNNRQNIIERVLAGKTDVEFYQTKLLLSSEGGLVNGGRYQLERPNFFILPQGRCAETLLFSTMSSMIAEGYGSHPEHGKPTTIISNGFFDTTGANAAVAGFQLQTFTQPGLTDPFPHELIGKKNNFKGNLDLTATESYLKENPGKVSMILVTITNNWAAAQPVSMANMRDAAALAKRHDIPLFLDACRFAENAYFIQKFEDGYADKSIAEIVQEMFSYAEGFTISLKKDGLANMGGVLCFRDEGLFAQRYEGIGMLLKERQILSYGNDSYGGMSGRDLMAASAGLYQVTDQSYLRNRIEQVQSFAQKLHANGIAVLSPPGGHAVYLDMDHFFFGCNRKLEDFAAVGFTLELIKEYGIRAAEAGPFGWAYDLKPSQERVKIPNLVRFAVPRHVYSDEHIDYTVAAIRDLYDRRHTVPNAVITRGKNMKLRHFSAGLKPVPVDPAINDTYLGEASRQLGHLSTALGQDAAAVDELTKALALATGEWGKTAVRQGVDQAGWVSGVCNDGSPIEYSVSIDQSSGKAELRFLTEAQPSQNTWEHLTAAALRVNEDIAASYPISLERFNLIRDLFMPTELPSTDPAKMAAWHSSAWSAAKGPQWKIYLDPCASGKENALSATREAFHRLGLKSGWGLVESILGPDDHVIYFSLDLASDADEARVKVYVAHGGADATSRSLVAEVAQKHVSICPDADAFEIQRFFAAMAGDDFGRDDSTPRKKSLISCFAFSSKTGERPVGTVHFPVDAYVSDDAEVKRRIDAYLASVGASATARERYAMVIAATQRRPLRDGRGIHAWASLKQRAGGKRDNTFYLCPEMFGPRPRL